MRKAMGLLCIFIIVLSSLTTALAITNTFPLTNNITLQNPNEENLKYYTLVTVGAMIVRDKNEFGDGEFFWSGFYLPIENKNIKNLKMYPYEPSISFDLENFSREITKYSKTQQEYNHYYYQKINNSELTQLSIEESKENPKELLGNYSFGYFTDKFTLDIAKLLKVPNGEQVIYDFLNVTKEDKSYKYIKNTIDQVKQDDNKSGYIFFYSFVVEWEEENLNVSYDNIDSYMGYWRNTPYKKNWSLWMKDSDKISAQEKEMLWPDELIGEFKTESNNIYIDFQYSGNQGGSMIAGYIEPKLERQEIKGFSSFMDENVKFFIEFKDGKVIIEATEDFSKNEGNKMIFDKHIPNVQLYDWESIPNEL